MISLTRKYELLTKLPLLQGLSGKELAHMESIIGMEVDELPPMSHPLIHQGDLCTRLIFLATGSMTRRYQSPDGLFRTQSVIQAPSLLEPHNLYGLNCHYQFSYIPQHEVSIITIPKIDVMQHLMRSEIFRINYLNLLSASIHKKETLLQPLRTPSVTLKIINFIQKLFAEAEGTCEISIKMRDLADYIGETRLNTSRALNKLETEQVIQLSRSLITIPDIKKLLQE